MPGVSAPTPPGALGVGVEPAAMRRYLIELDDWLSARRAELDDVDQVALAGEHSDEVSPDIALGLALWQAIKTRYQRLLAVWDGGRVDAKRLDELANLIFGRLDEADATAAKGLSLPEACKLSDALTSQLRVRLQIDKSGSEAIARIRDLKASVERIRDQVELEPADTIEAARAQAQQLAARVDDVSARAARGADVGGLLGPLEIATAKFERDLIVNSAKRRAQAKAMPIASENPVLVPNPEAVELRDELAKRGDQLRELAARVAKTVPNPPNYAVPDVRALGAVPAAGIELENYLSRLRKVSQALDIVEKAYWQAENADSELTKLRAVLAAWSTRQELSDLSASLEDIINRYEHLVEAEH